MSAEWKPGDVAMVTGRWVWNKPHNCRPAARRSNGWRALRGGAGVEDYEVSEVRPLVVIDPEDAEHVERLARRVWAEGGNDFDKEPPSSQVRIRCAWQAALREFANPTPPKPDEPTGLGAVVEDADGVRWVRVGGAIWPEPWLGCPKGSDDDVRSTYQGVTAVRVLSPGAEAAS